MLTDEQFNAKIEKRKKKKNLHSNLAMKYQGEINRLTDEREISKANAFCVGKYIICDGYYMKVDHYEKGKDNLSIYGSAFKPIQNGIVNVDLYQEDTSSLIPGDYHWNLAIMYASGDEPWTLFESAPLFIILPEDGRCDA